MLLVDSILPLIVAALSLVVAVASFYHSWRTRRKADQLLKMTKLGKLLETYARAKVLYKQLRLRVAELRRWADDELAEQEYLPIRREVFDHFEELADRALDRQEVAVRVFESQFTGDNVSPDDLSADKVELVNGLFEASITILEECMQLEDSFKDQSVKEEFHSKMKQLEELKREADRLQSN